MKTKADVDAYLASIERWQDEKGEVAEPGPKHGELYDFKGTLDLGGVEAIFSGTNVDEVWEADRGVLRDWATWSVKFVGLGDAHLHLYDLSEPGDSGTWAEFWCEGEPWWNGDDPYDCSWEQIAAIVRALAEEHRNRYLELASRSSELTRTLNKHGIMPEAPKP